MKKWNKFTIFMVFGLAINVITCGLYACWSWYTNWNIWLKVSMTVAGIVYGLYSGTILAFILYGIISSGPVCHQDISFSENGIEITQEINEES